MEAFLKDIKPFFFRRPIVYVDAGAYKGETFEALLESEMPLVEAHLFEPNPESFPLLEEVVRRHGEKRNLTRVSVHNAALGDREGKLAFQVGGGMTRALDALPGDPEALIGREKIFEASCVTLDGVSRRFFDRHISILKVDVEGHELEVLAGAEELLRAQDIDVIYIEAGMNPDSGQQTYYRAIEDVLAPHGYRLFKLYEQMHEWTQDAPLLRRVNLAFMSARFAANNPMRLSKEVFEANKKIHALTASLKQAEAEIGAAEEARADAEKAVASARAKLDAAQAKLGELDELRRSHAAARDELTALRASLAAGERRAASESARADAAEQRGAQAQAQVAALTSERDARLGDIASLKAALAASERRVRNVTKRAQAAERRVAQALADLAALTADRDAHRNALAALQASTAWRLTAPIRLLASTVSGLRTRLRSRAAIRAISACELFDRPWYLKRYPDVAVADVDPVRHYVLFGAAEGRDPGPSFSTKGYRERYADVTAGRMNPLHHYIVYGEREGRSTQRLKSEKAAKLEAQLVTLATPDTPAEVSKCLDAIKAVQAYDAGDALKAFSRTLLDERRHAFVIALCEALGQAPGIAPRVKAIAALCTLCAQADRGRFSTVLDLYEVAASYERDACYFGDESSALAAAAAEALLAVGRRDDASALLADRVKRPSAQAELREIEARAIAATDPAAAAGILRTLREGGDLAKSSRRHAMRLLLAELESGLGNHDAARALLLEGLGEPDAPEDYHLGLANVALRSGRHDDQRRAIDAYFGSQRLWSPAAGATGAFRIDGIAPSGLGDARKGPLVTVAMAAFNAAEHIERAVRSVLAQTYAKLELYIVDDLSTDGTREKIAALAAGDARIRICLNATHTGPYVARNRAVAISSGALVTFLDPLEWWHPKHLEWHVRRMTKRPDFVATRSRRALLNDAGAFALERGAYTQPNPSSVMVRRKVIEEVGPFDSVRLGADEELWGRLEARYGAKAVSEMSACLALAPARHATPTTADGAPISPENASRLALAYREAWSRWRQEMWARSQPPRMPFPMETRPFEAPGEILGGVVTAEDLRKPGERRGAKGRTPPKKPAPKRRHDEARILDARRRMLNLGFCERGATDMIRYAEATTRPRLRTLAAWELANWHLNQQSAEHAHEAIKYIYIASEAARDSEERYKAAIMLAEAKRILGDTAASKAILQKLLFDTSHPDVFLALAAAETGLEAKLQWINVALSCFNLDRIGLDSREGLKPYDRLLGAAPQSTALKDQPLVSILMPAFNSADIITTAMRSISQQTWRNFELLVIDDCSTDGTADVVSAYARDDDRVRLIRAPTNAGPYVARNIALAESSGAFITCNDADDWSHPRKIETQALHLLENERVVGNTSWQARATADLIFHRRGKIGQYLFQNMSSFMFRREPVLGALGHWDSVRFGADSEFIRRAAVIFGEGSIADLSTGPLSFQRQCSSSLTGNSAFGYHGFFMGARQEYFERFMHYHRTASNLKYEFPLKTRPFAVPEPLWPKREPKPAGRRRFDVVIASDFRLDGGSTHSNIEEIRAMSGAGWRVGLVQMARYDMPPSKKMNPKVVDLLDGDLVQMLVYGEKVSCDLLIVRYPPILQDHQRFVPDIEAGDIRVIVNQPPMSDYGENAVLRYEIPTCAERLRGYFGKDATWHPIGPAVRAALHEHHGDDLGSINLAAEDWENIIDVAAWRRAQRPSPRGRPWIGRHARDSEVKWPDNRETLLQVYPTSDKYQVCVMGGADVPARMLGGVPSNWRVLPFDGVPVKEYLAELDVFVYFTHSAWVESFGRVVLEAMAAGVPVIVPHSYRPLFGESALYAEPKEVLPLVDELMADPARYDERARYALDYVEKRFGYGMHLERVRNIIRRASGAGAVVDAGAAIVAAE